MNLGTVQGRIAWVSKIIMNVHYLNPKTYRKSLTCSKKEFDAFMEGEIDLESGVLLRMCSIYRINSNWILNGKEEPFLDIEEVRRAPADDWTGKAGMPDVAARAPLGKEMIEIYLEKVRMIINSGLALAGHFTDLIDIFFKALEKKNEIKGMMLEEAVLQYEMRMLEKRKGR